MKKPAAIIIVAVIAAVAGILWWRQSSSPVVVPADTGGRKLQGTLVAPPGFTPSEFTIVSHGESHEVSADGTFTAAAYDAGVTVVAAMLRDKEFGLVNIIVTDEGVVMPQNVTIDAQTTAVGLVFATPQLMTSDPEQAKEILAVIARDPKVAAFAAVIGQVLQSDDPLAQPEYSEALQAALASVMATLNP